MIDNATTQVSKSTNRRDFIKSMAKTTLATLISPTILRASDKTGRRNTVMGTGAHKYEAIHGWGNLPDHIQWGNTHGVCIDANGLIYIKHQSAAETEMDAIAVFDPEGKFVRSFGKEYHGGGHGLDIRQEGNQEFLYLCDIKHRKVVKTDLKGEQLWSLSYPVEANLYENDKKFVPTNVAFAPDGGFYVGDGYGSHYIHQYDQNAKWIRSWGGEGTAQGKMKTPHGLWLDDRPGRTPSLVVADRANARLQYFTLDGQHLGFVESVSFPAHFDIRNTDLLVPDLHARVTILDGQNNVITHLGYNQKWTDQVLDGFKIRTQPETWEEGRFIHPHDACYDQDGNIFVAEWVSTGRITKLRHLS